MAGLKGTSAAAATTTNNPPPLYLSYTFTQSNLGNNILEELFSEKPLSSLSLLSLLLFAVCKYFLTGLLFFLFPSLSLSLFLFLSFFFLSCLLLLSSSSFQLLLLACLFRVVSTLPSLSQVQQQQQQQQPQQLASFFFFLTIHSLFLSLILPLHSKGAALGRLVGMILALIFGGKIAAGGYAVGMFGRDTHSSFPFTSFFFLPVHSRCSSVLSLSYTYSLHHRDSV